MADRPGKMEMGAFGRTLQLTYWWSGMLNGEGQVGMAYFYW